MKIAINTRFILPGKMEGFGHITYELAVRLAEQHPENQFYFLFDRRYSRDFVFPRNVTPVVLFPPARHPVLWYLWFEWAVPRALKSIQPDIFFSPDGYLSLRTPVKTLMMCHDISWIHFPDQLPWTFLQYYKYFTPRFLRRADRLITLSQHARRDISQYYDIPMEKFDLTHAASHGAFRPLSNDEKVRTRAAFSDGQEYFLYVGAIHPRKNVHRLINAFNLFRERTGVQMKLLLAGRFYFKKGAILQAYETSPYKADIVFTGYLDDALYAVTGSAFASVYVSLFEGFGMPLVEAMQCHVPVITSNVTSMPEVIGDAGLLVSPESEEEICDAMTRLCSDRDLYARLQQNAATRKSIFNWDRAAQDVYRSMLHILEQ